MEDREWAQKGNRDKERRKAKVLAVAVDLTAIFLSGWAVLASDTAHHMFISVVTVASLTMPVAAILLSLRYPQYLSIAGNRGGIGNLSLAVLFPTLLAFLPIWPAIPEGMLSGFEMGLALTLGSVSAVLTLLILKIPRRLMDKVTFFLLSYCFAFSLVFHLTEIFIAEH